LTTIKEIKPHNLKRAGIIATKIRLHDDMEYKEKVIVEALQTRDRKIEIVMEK